MITTAHCPSAANNNYWPEMYTNMSLLDANQPHPYGDTLNPKLFGAVSSLDPEFFSRIDDFADELLQQRRSARYSPVWVAQWLDEAASNAESFLIQSQRTVRDPRSAEFRRLATDVAIQFGLGRFFAWKFRAGILYALYERSGYRQPLEQSLHAYRKARAAWAELADRAKDVYARDITFGYERQLRGHWLDRFPAIDQDIAALEKLLESTNSDGRAPLKVARDLIERALRAMSAESVRPSPPALTRFHVPPPRFERGQALILEASLAGSNLKANMESIHLRYRHVDQAEIWQVQAMEPQVAGYRAAILGSYTDSPFPLQYHFELRTADGAAWFHPGLRPGALSQPYFVLHNG